MAKLGEYWSFSQIAAANATSSKDHCPLPQPTSSAAANVLCAMQKEVERIIRERWAAAWKPRPFRRPKPDSDARSGDDDEGGATIQSGMAYEVTVKYRIA